MVSLESACDRHNNNNKVQNECTFTQWLQPFISMNEFTQSCTTSSWHFRECWDNLSILSAWFQKQVISSMIKPPVIGWRARYLDSRREGPISVYGEVVEAGFGQLELFFSGLNIRLQFSQRPSSLRCIHRFLINNNRELQPNSGFPLWITC